MRRILGRAGLLALCLLVASAAFAGHVTRRGAAQPASQTIFGIDTPADGATVFGIVDVQGFVLDPRGVSRITLLVDGAAVHDADINQPRSDVRRKYPNYQGGEFPYEPGFVTSFLASNYPAGNHSISIRVTYSNSDVAELGSRAVTVNNTINQAPIGALDNPRDPYVTGTQDYVSGVYPIVGWTLDAEGIRTTTAPDGRILADIEVMVDNRVVGQAVYPLPRPDVANAHPDVSGALNSGFQMNLDTTRFAIGNHTISVRVWDTQGMSSIIGSRDLYFDNNYTTIAPFGRIDWPMSNAHLFATSCVLGGPSGLEYHFGNRIEWVSGWVLDQNEQQRFEGVKYVELLLDGVILHRTTTECRYLSQFGMDVNCYGYERPDILYEYPQFAADAKYSGFFFAVDVDYLLNTLGIHPGLHYLAIRAGTQDAVRPAVIVDQIPVILECNHLGQGFSSFGDLESPPSMQSTKGIQILKGWVYDFETVVTLNVYVDGVLDGSLVGSDPNLHIYRPDLLIKYPFYPRNILENSGFQYSLDTTKYVDGIHQIVLETVDMAGLHNYWVQRALVFNNAN